jgi:hypothetical protein
MFHWKGDDVWVNTLTDAPILDPLLGGLFLLGLIVVIWRAIRERDPIGPLLLTAGVILLLPSALSLAYAVENPSVVRAGGAIPVVMIVAALPVSLLLQRRSPVRWTAGDDPSGIGGLMRRNWRRGTRLLAGCILATAIIVINYQRYFSDYWAQYERTALNTTEIASAIHGFVESGGDLDNAWIIAWPHWIDTRGVGIELGDPPWNNVILNPEELQNHGALLKTGSPHSRAEALPRFYALYRDDWKTLQQLHLLFPSGWSSRYAADHPHRDFLIFYVPRESPQGLMRDTKGTIAHAP